MIATLTDLFDWRAGRPIAFGSFTTTTREDMLGVVDAAEELGVPVILQASRFQLDVASIDLWAMEAQRIAREAEVLVCVHLDHGHDFEVCSRALRHGFTSVMRDGSKLQLRDNIMETRKVVDMAHAMGVSVEGELGQIGGVEDELETGRPDQYTDPKEAEAFVAETGVDALAIAVGTAHGLYSGPITLKPDLAKEIATTSRVPVVLHGGSGLERHDLLTMIEAGVAKINIGTELKLAHVAAWKQAFDASTEPTDPRNVLPLVRASVRRVATAKLSIFSELLQGQLT